jgi:hypothetical protein
MFIHLGINVYNLERLLWFEITSSPTNDDIKKKDKLEVFACFPNGSSTVYMDQSLENAKQTIESKLPPNCFICVPHDNRYRYVNIKKSFYYDFEEHILVFPNMEPLDIVYEPSWNFKTSGLWPNKAINMTQSEDFKIWMSENKFSIYLYFTVGRGYDPHKLKSVLIDTMEDAQYFLHHLALE